MLEFYCSELPEHCIAPNFEALAKLRQHELQETLAIAGAGADLAGSDWTMFLAGAASSYFQLGSRIQQDPPPSSLIVSQ